MRYVLAALATLIAGAFPAVAADLGGRAAPADPAPAAVNSGYRTGPYAGLVVGYSTSQITGDLSHIATDGMQLGGLAGFTFKGAGLVWGLEGDIGWQNAKLSSSGIQSSGDWLGSARVRAGVPVGPALLYATAGAAFKDSFDGFTVGAVAGGGIDLQMTHTMLMRIEALHYMYPDAKISIDNLDALKIGTSDTTVRAALIFNLN